ncbi:hypothetical protein SDC9_92165 [bioreactor metagenome]|uniref:Flp/Fap pilin component n=1 Tax=bioreactor metagenome TaxID=1076179 RepID=A0A644ZYH4_9ZZZZ
MEIMRRLVQEEEGQGLVEYALIIALISLVVLTSGNAIAAGLSTVFTNIQNRLTGVTP